MLCPHVSGSASAHNPQVDQSGRHQRELWQRMTKRAAKALTRSPYDTPARSRHLPEDPGLENRLRALGLESLLRGTPSWCVNGVTQV